ncbi:TPA: hypothetical protein ACTV7K_001072 [Enterobacter hormaechei]
MTANKPMTGEQLEELMTIAVNMQRDSEKVSDRPVAMFAYAVQVAVLELRKVRNEAAALAAENGQMLRLLTDISENHDEYVSQDEYLYAGVPMEYVSEINSYVSRDVEAENPFKETDAFLDEVRANAIKSALNDCTECLDRDCIMDLLGISYEDAALREAGAMALHDALLRKGVQS